MNTVGFSTLIVAMLLPVLLLAPGLFVVRRWRLSPREKVGAAIGTSLFLLSMAGFWGAGLFASPAPKPREWDVHAAWPAMLFAAACVALLPVVFGDLRKLWRHPIAGRMLAAQAALMVFVCALLAVMVVPSGGDWAGDFWEHYQRTGVFLGLYPVDRLIITLYTLPARPPLTNAAAAGVMCLAPIKDFPAYQLAFAGFATLAFAGFATLAPMMLKRSRPLPWKLAAVLVCLPMFWQNCTFSWTKLPTAFYLALSLAFYLTGLRKESSLRKGLAFFFASCAILTHYSAIPIVLLMTLHYIAVHLRAWRREVPRALAFLAISVLTLSTWFAYSINHFGLKGTLTANSTATGYGDGESTATKLEVTAKNFRASLIPYFARGYPTYESDQTSFWGRARENTFFFYQTCLPGLIGLACGAALLMLLRDQFRSASTPMGRPAETRFWLYLLPLSIVIGILTHPPTPHPYGLAHVVLIPSALALVTLATQALSRLSTPQKLAIGALMLIDFMIGIELHYYVQSILPPYRVAQGVLAFDDPHFLSLQAMKHLQHKLQSGLPTFHDFFVGLKPFLLAGLIFCGLTAAVSALRGRPSTPHGGQ